MFAPFAVRPWVFLQLMLACLISIVVMIFRTNQRARRLYRAHEGLCLECGYDVRASAILCSECGTPIERPEKLVEGKWDVEAAALRYLVSRSAKITNPKTYRSTVLCQIHAMDQLFLRKRTADLIALGFRPFGELATGTRLLLAFRVFGSEDNHVIATAGSLITFEVYYWSEAERHFGFQSELSDETFVVTYRILCPQNRQLLPRTYPGIDQEFRFDRIDACELFEFHRKRVAQKIMDVPSRSVVMCRNLPESLASQRRLELKKCAHQAPEEFPDEATLRASFPNRSEEWLKALANEMNQLKARSLSERPKS